MATYNTIKHRVRLELSELAQITFLDEELFLYAIEGCRLLHSMIASINPLYVMSGRKIYHKLSDYKPYVDMQWYRDYLEASQLVSLHNYLDINEDGVVDQADYDLIIGMDEVIDGKNALYDFLKLNDKMDVVNMDELELPDTCMFISDLFINNGSTRYKLQPVNLDIVMYNQEPYNTPIVFCRTGNKLTLSPFPDRFYKYMLMYASSYIEPVAYDDGFSISETFMPYIVEYIVLRAHNRNDRKTLVEQIFLNQKGSIIESLITKESNQMQVIPTLTNIPYLTNR